MELNIIRIEISQKDANLFKRFREFQDDFTEMLGAGVFNFKNGMAIITRDNDGTLRDIEIKEKRFIRKSKKK